MEVLDTWLILQRGRCACTAQASYQPQPPENSAKHTVELLTKSRTWYSSLPNTSLGWGKSENLEQQDSSLGWEKEKTQGGIVA